jgi:predicted Zn finger-like uncharacterized protein
MFTICPKCTLVLAVTTADLRTGQGYVRCGRCANVFNALLTLSEEPASRHDPVSDAAQPAEQRAPTAVPANDPIAAAAEHAPIATPAAAAAAPDVPAPESTAGREPAPEKPTAATEAWRAGQRISQHRHLRDHRARRRYLFCRPRSSYPKKRGHPDCGGCPATRRRQSAALCGARAEGAPGRGTRAGRRGGAGRIPARSGGACLATPVAVCGSSCCWCWCLPLRPFITGAISLRCSPPGRRH